MPDEGEMHDKSNPTEVQKPRCWNFFGTDEPSEESSSSPEESREYDSRKRMKVIFVYPYGNAEDAGEEMHKLMVRNNTKISDLRDTIKLYSKGRNRLKKVILMHTDKDIEYIRNYDEEWDNTYMWERIDKRDTFSYKYE